MGPLRGAAARDTAGNADVSAICCSGLWGFQNKKIEEDTRYSSPRQTGRELEWRTARASSRDERMLVDTHGESARRLMHLELSRPLRRRNASRPVCRGKELHT